jgi:hypothetical protein
VSVCRAATVIDALVGAQSGVVGVWLTIPFEKVQQKTATSKDENGKPIPATEIFNKILKEEGVAGFWNGIQVKLG